MSIARTEMPRSREAGGITVFFVLFTVVLAGAIAASLYVGRMVDRKIRLANAADAAAHAMASHGAIGMNMIAANNLAVAANLHVGASVPFVGRYYAIIKAYLLDSTSHEDIKDVGLLNVQQTAERSSFKDGFEWTRRLTGHFIKSSAGVTSVNVQLGKWWLAPALVKGVEQMRLNEPGSVGLPMQVGGARFARFEYDSLRLSRPEATMCQTISASAGVRNRDFVTHWVGGALESLGADAETILAPIKVGEHIARNIELITGIFAAYAAPVIAEQTAECAASNVAAFLNPACYRAATLVATLATMTQPPTPEFESCGISHGGNNGEQFSAFTSDKVGEKNAIGFVFPAVDAGNLESYEKSLQFAQLVGSPLYLAKELETRNGKQGHCPEEWKFVAGGRKYCSAILDGSDLDRAVGGAVHAKLDDIWSRVQWAVGQATMAYEPNGSQGDPVAADLRSIPASQKDARAQARSMQLFWPAWRARAREATAVGDFLAKLGKLGQTPGT